jgi:hypothetical protein
MGTPLGAVLFLALSEARASCEASAVDGAIATAERSFAAGDARSMGAALEDARRTLGCLRAPLPPEACARLHRARALEASLAGDADMVDASLRAMVHAAPLMGIPAALVPARHPLRAALVRAEESLPTSTEGPAGGWLYVDGLRTGVVPVGQPYVLQRTKPDGRTLGAKLVDGN